MMSTDIWFWVVTGAVLTAIACSLYCSKREERKKPTTAFLATRLTSSTFLLSEYNDIYGEHPQIFVKLVPAACSILIIDTGCGGATLDSDIEITSLRKFIEEVPLNCNGGAALNEGKAMEYVVVATHCHYDHIRETSVRWSRPS